MKITIVVPAKNEESRVGQCLEALATQKLHGMECEVIVVDDGSDDNTARVAARSGARVIRSESRGAAAARNHGIEAASGEIILFTDADCIAGEKWAATMARPIIEGEADGVVGRIASSQRQFMARFIQAELEERYSRMSRQEQIDFVSSGNCGFRRDLIKQNRFDESFRWAEDLELSFRLAAIGSRMVFVQDAIVEHPHPTKLSAYLRRKFVYASWAPLIYRRHPQKLASDSRTPGYLRWQMVCAALAMVMAPVEILINRSLYFTAGLLGAWTAFSYPIIRSNFRQSPALAILAPFIALLGNLAFLAGTLRGISRLKPND
jgi:glycosyltransferase involved in cell wall biosynthesis